MIWQPFPISQGFVPWILFYTLFTLMIHSEETYAIMVWKKEVQTMDENDQGIIAHYVMRGKNSKKKEFLTYILKMTMFRNDNLMPEDKETLEKYIEQEKDPELRWAMKQARDYLFDTPSTNKDMI